MRASIPELISPHPLGMALPAVYHEDPVIQSFLTALDDVLAALFCTLDNMESYLDPALTPPDFLEWLGGWVGMVLDEHWPLERRRILVQKAVELYRWRGTVKGLAAHVALHTGSEPEIEESGGLTWSSRPGQAVPGTADAFVRVRVRVPDPLAINAEKLSVMIGAALPADIIHELVIEQIVDDAPDEALAEAVEEPAEEPAAEEPVEAAADEAVAEDSVADEPVGDAVVEGPVVDEVAEAEVEEVTDEAGDQE